MCNLLKLNICHSPTSMAYIFKYLDLRRIHLNMFISKFLSNYNIYQRIWNKILLNQIEANSLSNCLGIKRMHSKSSHHNILQDMSKNTLGLNSGNIHLYTMNKWFEHCRIYIYLGITNKSKHHGFLQWRPQKFQSFRINHLGMIIYKQKMFKYNHKIIYNYQRIISSHCFMVHHKSNIRSSIVNNLL